MTIQWNTMKNKEKQGTTMKHNEQQWKQCKDMKAKKNY